MREIFEFHRPFSLDFLFQRQRGDPGGAFSYIFWNLVKDNDTFVVINSDDFPQKTFPHSFFFDFRSNIFVLFFNVFGRLSNTALSSSIFPNYPIPRNIEASSSPFFTFPETFPRWNVSPNTRRCRLVTANEYGLSTSNGGGKKCGDSILSTERVASYICIEETSVYAMLFRAKFVYRCFVSNCRQSRSQIRSTM